MASHEIVVDITPPEHGVLSAPLEPAFDYTRSTGPVLGAFFTALRSRRLIGMRDARGRVHCPPIEFDPQTREPLDDLVDIGEGTSIEGYVTAWTRVTDPGPGRPSIWALVRCDGADSAMVLPVDADEGHVMVTRSRVRLVWSGECTGTIHDIAGVVPAEQPVSDTEKANAELRPEADAEDVTGVVTPISMSVEHNAAPAESEFLRAITKGTILGRRRSNGPEVYVPPRDYCPSDGVPMGEYVEVSDHGTVTTFGIVNVPFLGQKVKPPYVTAYVLLDGADVPVQHLVLGCEASEVRMGMRVRAVWAPEGDRPASMQAITHFEPSGEPDAEPDSYARHL